MLHWTFFLWFASYKRKRLNENEFCIVMSVQFLYKSDNSGTNIFFGIRLQETSLLKFNVGLKCNLDILENPGCLGDLVDLVQTSSFSIGGIRGELTGCKPLNASLQSLEFSHQPGGFPVASFHALTVRPPNRCKTSKHSCVYTELSCKKLLSVHSNKLYYH